MDKAPSKGGEEGTLELRTMRISRLGGALGVCASAALLAGCAATQLPFAAPGAMLQSHGSRMQRAGTSGDLLYVTRPPSRSVDVYTYPAGNQVGTLTGFTNPYGICSDAQGNVWIADDTAGSFSAPPPPRATTARALTPAGTWKVC
jgi:streptogramin lyase